MNIFLFTIFFCIALFLYCMVLPLYTQFGLAQITLAAEKSRIANIEAFLNRHTDVAAFEQEINRKLAKVNLQLPDKADVSVFMDAVEKTAANAGVQVLGIQRHRTDDLGVYSELPLTVRIQGDYWQVMDFFYRLENVERFKVLKMCSVKKEQDVLLAEITLSIFYEQGKVSEKQENHAEVSNLS